MNKHETELRPDNLGRHTHYTIDDLVVFNFPEDKEKYIEWANKQKPSKLIPFVIVENKKVIHSNKEGNFLYFRLCDNELDAVYDEYEHTIEYIINNNRVEYDKFIELLDKSSFNVKP